MHLLDGSTLSHILATYGYYAIFFVILLESAGVPMPGETMLVGGAVLASSHKGLDIRFVIAAAAAGAIVGDNIGYWIGRAYGEKLLMRFGPRIGFDVRKQKLGQYLFRRYGGLIVFFGRFFALLRTYAALLAGINRLEPWKFFCYNATGGIVWALLFGLGGYMIGQGIERVAGPVGYIGLVCFVIGAIAMWRFFKKHEEALLSRAEREMDGAALEGR